MSEGNKNNKKDNKENSVLVFKHKWQFLLLILGVFFVTFSFLSLVGFVPEQDIDNSLTKDLTKDSAINIAEASEHIVVVSEPRNPLHITIPSVGVDVRVENPESRDIEVLDRALNSGAVHYPGTGSLTEDANIFLFGHSSFLPNLINKNYQAFNGLRKLKGGEEIFVDSYDTRYVYQVVAAADEIRVNLERGERTLTLSTCNSFGAEAERYIVKANFVGSYILAN